MRHGGATGGHSWEVTDKAGMRWIYGGTAESTLTDDSGNGFVWALREVLARLLHTLDTGSLPLALQRADGSYGDLSELGCGELAGWLYDDEGWRARFSRARFNA